MDSHRTQRTIAVWLAILWLVMVAIVLSIAALSDEFEPGFLISAYLWLTVVASVISFFAYAIDKRRANMEQPRISEKRLHLLAMVGGWPGALLGQQCFRHKTLKVTFRLVLWFIILAHVSVFAWCVYLSARGSQT